MDFLSLNNRMEKGFTVIELMVVVVIIAILFGVAIPEYKKYLRTATSEDLIALAAEIISYEKTYYTLNSSYNTLNISPSNSKQIYGDNTGGKIVIPKKTAVSVVLINCTLKDLSSGSSFSSPGFNVTITRNNAPGGPLTVKYNSCADTKPRRLTQ